MRLEFLEAEIFSVTLGTQPPTCHDARPEEKGRGVIVAHDITHTTIITKHPDGTTSTKGYDTEDPKYVGAEATGGAAGDRFI